jgi:pimeloyl-ACP methyl ester carboxylesterase
LSRKRIASLGALLGLALVAWPAWRFVRAARNEQSAFEPPRGPVQYPPAAPPHEAVRFGQGLAGSWVAPTNGAAIVLAHGSGTDRTQLHEELRFLAHAGFGVLAFDWPGHGESDGEVRVGSGEVRALRAAVDFVAGKDGVQNARIGVVGVSVGAAIAVVAASEDPRVRALVAAGAFTSAVEQTRAEYEAHGWFAQQGALWIARSRMDGGDFRPVDVAAKLRGRRSLFVVCDEDRTVPPWMGEALAREAGGDLWRRPGCGHMDWGGEAWEARVVAFLREALDVAAP